MPLFIGGQSAIEFWRSAKSRGVAKPTRAKPAAKSGPKTHEFRLTDFDRMGIAGRPVSLIVRDAESRRRISGARCQVWGGSALAGAFLKVSDGLYVASPEACFVQMAERLSLEQSVKLGMELCGSYALNSQVEGGFSTREPLTSTKSMSRFVERATGVNGAKRARRALEYVLDGSASPAETNAAILLCLPPLLGGYGLPMPQLNAKIEVSKSAKQLASRQYYKCDLFWPQIKTAVEYDSDSWHLGTRARANDAAKRNAIDAMGLTVITLTKGQLYDAREMDRVALILAKKFGRYHRSTCKGTMTRRYELRRTVLFGDRDDGACKLLPKTPKTPKTPKSNA